MSKISIVLDGRKVEVEEGKTVLEAAKEYGVNIPTLCHDERLKPTAACRLCLVEVQNARGPVPACNTLVTKDMVINTTSGAINESRRIALELLLSDHRGDCLSPCKIACPAGIDIQAQIAYIANGNYFEALKLIKESNPLPLVCGRVCPRFCERKCRRTLVDKPVAINMLKRFVSDIDLSNGGPYTAPVKPATGHRVAVVGGGPAGLAAAYYLALEGHMVSIFDANPKLGGMLRYGIPEYRLPKATLDKEIAAITKLCREVKSNVSLGKDFTIDSLKKEGYEAIFLALGAQTDQKMQITGEDQPGVYSGIGFLRDVVLGKRVEIGRKVVVVGGGNTAIDAARTAVRLGAEEVTIVYRRSRQEMPANAEEVEGAEEEGVKFQFLSNPVKLNGANGRVKSIECVKMALGAPDASGRRRPEPVAGSEFAIEADAVIMAIGQGVDASGLGANSAVKMSKRGGIAVNEETMETTQPGVFAGGDCASGPATAVEGIGAGHRAATYIDQYLKGQKVTPLHKNYNCSKGELDQIDKKEFADIERVERAVMTALKPEVRRNSFEEIDSVISEEAARKEAGRCLSCGCQDIYECKLRQLATEYHVNDKTYAGKKRNLPIKEKEHHYILRDQNKCILCGRCVRICQEVEGASALGFARRGISASIEPSLGLPLSETTCDSCGQCVSTCPTGAMTPKVPLAKPGPFEMEAISTICPYCGIGCSLELNVAGNQIIKVTSPIGSAVNNGNLCYRGAFKVNEDCQQKRLLTPMIDVNGSPTKAGWEEALAAAAKGLLQIKKKYGAGSIAVLSSPVLTNEENYLVQKIARLALGTNNIGSLWPFIMNDSLTNSLGRNATTCSYKDVTGSDFILVYGTDLSRDYPVMAIKVREAAAKGSKIIMMNNAATGLDQLAQSTLKVNRRTSMQVLLSMLWYLMSSDMIDREFIRTKTAGYNALAAEIKGAGEEIINDIPWVKLSRIKEVVTQFNQARNPIIIVNSDTVTPAEVDLLNNIALATGKPGKEGSGIIMLRTPGNAQGLLDMGISPDYLPGQELLTASSRRKFEAKWGARIPSKKGKYVLELLSGIEQGEIRGLLVAGREALGKVGTGILSMPLFSVMISSELPAKAPYASVTLPGATFAETEGTYTNCERRIQKLQQAVQPAAGKQNWQILAALANALGYAQDYNSAAEIFQEIAELVPGYKAGEQWQYVSGESFPIKGGRAQFTLPELEAEEISELLKPLS